MATDKWLQIIVLNAGEREKELERTLLGSIGKTVLYYVKFPYYYRCIVVIEGNILVLRRHILKSLGGMSMSVIIKLPNGSSQKQNIHSQIKLNVVKC